MYVRFNEITNNLLRRCVQYDLYSDGITVELHHQSNFPTNPVLSRMVVLYFTFDSAADVNATKMPLKTH